MSQIHIAKMYTYTFALKIISYLDTSDVTQIYEDIDVMLAHQIGDVLWHFVGVWRNDIVSFVLLPFMQSLQNSLGFRIAVNLSMISSYVLPMMSEYARLKFNELLMDAKFIHCFEHRTELRKHMKILQTSVFSYTPRRSRAIQVDENPQDRLEVLRIFRRFV